MEITQRPLNKDRANQLKQWLKRSELSLLLEQITILRILEEQEAIKELYLSTDNEACRAYANAHMQKAAKYKFMHEELHRLSGQTDAEGVGLEVDFFELDIRPTTRTIKTNMSHE